MKFRLSRLFSLLTVMLLHAQITFGMQAATEVKRSQAPSPAIQILPLDADDQKASCTAALELNNALDALYKKNQSLLKDLKDADKAMQKTSVDAGNQGLDAEATANKILSLRIKYSQIETAYDQYSNKIFQLLLSSDEQHLNDGLSEANKELRSQYFSSNYVAKALQAAARANDWNLIRQSLRNHKTQKLIGTEAVNALFLRAVFNNLIDVVTDILESQTLIEKLKPTTVGYAYICARKRSKEQSAKAIIDTFRENPIITRRWLAYQDQSTKLDTTHMDDVDLEVCAATNNLFVF